MTLLLLLLTLGACKPSDHALYNQDSGGGPGPAGAQPDIDVDPARADFGVLRVVEGPAEAAFLVQNLGDADLRIQELELVDPGGLFAIADPGAALLPPGGSARVTVRFAPTTMVSTTASLLVHSNDPDEPTLTLPLTGEGSAPVLTIDPASYDFGTRTLGCEAVQPLTLTNAGNELLTVDAVDAVTASEELGFDLREDINGPLPWSLEPGESRVFEARYRAVDLGQDVQILGLQSNDPAQPTALATQSGVGLPYEEVVDVWVQPLSDAADVLFSIDTSCSMADDVQGITDNFETFIRALENLHADYHVAMVVDGETGCVAGDTPFIDSSMTTDEQFAAVSQMLGGQGLRPEATLERLMNALSADNLGPGGCNEGFWRDHARLHLVGISDEREQSAEPWDAYVPRFQAMKSSPTDVLVHAVAGDYPNGCGTADAALGLYEATVATGGLFLSLCIPSFAPIYEQLAGGIAVTWNEFELSGYPVEETLVVELDGVPQSAGWVYSALDNAVRFEDDAIPAAGVQITIRYAVLGGCDA